MLRGGIALCENAVIKMGAKIYSGTTVGPYCKAGGELNNVLMFGYSNKGHDGFLGNAVIGEWCNIGAATDASNLKNNYGKLKLWNYEEERFSKTDLQFWDSLWEIIVAVVSIPHLIQLPSLVFALIFLERAFHEHFCQVFLWGAPKD